MKLKNIFLAGCLLVAGLSSCEMKNELLDGEKVSGETGILDLSVAVNSANNVVTKAEEGVGTEVTVPAVDPTGYELLIENSDKSYSKTHIYDPENTGIELPVGKYTVYAHTPGEATTTDPYYGGNGSFEITAGSTMGVEVLCKMENTKFQITFSEELKNEFKSWTVSVSAVGVDYLAKDFSATSDNVVQPDAFYWMLPDNVKIIRVDFTGVNNDGQTINDYREYQKPAAADDPNWTGADALAVSIGVSENTDPTGVPSITIDAEVTWDGLEDNVSVPVDGVKDPDDKPEPPTPSTGDEPVITMPKEKYELPADATTGVDSDVKITSTAEGGIQNIMVQIVGGGSFADISSGLGTFDLMNCGELAGAIQGVAPTLELPTPGISDYTFPVGAFFSVLQMICASDEKPVTHTFNITVKDANGSTDKSLSIVITQ